MESKTIKIVGWHVVVLICALLMWGSGHSLSYNSITGVDIQLPSLIAFLLLVSVIGLGFIFFQPDKEDKDRMSLLNWTWPLTVSLIVGGLFVSQFGPTWLNLIGVSIFAAFCYDSYNRMGRELKERMKVNIAMFLRHGLMPIVLGIFVMISFAAYQSPLADQIKSSGRLPTQSKAFFQQVIEKTFGSKIDAANPQDRQRIMNEIAAETYNDINNFLKPYFQYAPPTLAFGLFLILWGLSWLFVLLATGVGMFLFWILKKSHFVSIGTRDVKAETLVI